MVMDSTILTSCPHLASLCTPDGLQRLQRASEWLFHCIHSPVLNLPSSRPLCVHPECPHPSLNLFICLHCTYVACHAPKCNSSSPSHLTSHYNNSKHALYLSCEHKRIYCAACCDFVYHRFLDPALDLQKLRHRARANNLISSRSTIDPPSPPPRKKARRLLSKSGWTASQQELDVIARYSSPISVSKNSTARPPVGLFNLGNSCYMNSVLQAFLNVTPLRNYFLANLHRPTCDRAKDCFACVLDQMVCDASIASECKKSGGLDMPFLVPRDVLDIIWRHSKDLARYAQHDAHEFLLAAVNLLSSHCKGDEKPGAKGEERLGINIVQTLFCGTLQSDVVCRECGKSSPKTEPFYDISVDVEEEGGRLEDCLERFTGQERLGVGGMRMCEVCGEQREMVKQMSIRSLPPVICFHFKRFEKSFALRRNEMVKIEKTVEFPKENLDLTPFQTSQIVGKREGKLDLIKVRNNEDGIYDLCAIVNHGGSIDSGHYTALVRREGVWFKCDDDHVLTVDDDQQHTTVIRSKEAYLVFYVQRYPNFQY